MITEQNQQQMKKPFSHIHNIYLTPLRSEQQKCASTIFTTTSQLHADEIHFIFSLKIRVKRLDMVY